MTKVEIAIAYVIDMTSSAEHFSSSNWDPLHMVVFWLDPVCPFWLLHQWYFLDEIVSLRLWYSIMIECTPARTLSISGLKSRILKLSFFNLKMMMKNYLDFFFEIHRAPLEIPANLPGQFSLSGQIFLHWAAVTLKGLGEFQNKKF